MREENLKIKSKKYKCVGVDALIDPNNEKQKGITLIALIITIIILLILSGVTISLTLGENGLFNTAKQSTEEYTKTQLKEELELAIVNIQTKKIEQGLEFTRADLTELSSVGATIESIGIPAVGGYKNYYFIIDENYNVTIVENLNNIEIIEIPSISISDITTDGFKITMQTNYAEGTVSEIKYYIDGKLQNSGTTQNEYEVTGLSSDTVYENIYAEVYFSNNTIKQISNKESVRTKKRMYLYNIGEQYIDLTGGYIGYYAEGSSSALGSYTFADEYMEVRTNGEWCRYAIKTNESIDLTEFSKMYIDCSMSGFSSAWTDIAIKFSSKGLLSQGTSYSFNGILEFDISQLTNGQLVFTTANGAYIKVYRIWVEN